MSSYKQATRNPQTGQYETAEWRDDYFGSHIYGVYFPSNEKTYPVEMVEAKAIYDFWKDDVLEARRRELYGDEDQDWTDEMEGAEVAFLNLVEESYKRRWKRDPETGEGATKKSKVVYENNN